ncbi:hypothetical protein [Thermococcus henrietii]|uniref:hypothetical protein n=1 Tax=Thermococcus henrietii TaxID=2016361 RepID=UPI0011AB6A6C|nr:hypothetical protein [Thermococcus henrietii]
MKFRLKESIGALSRTCRKVKGIIHRIRLADIIPYSSMEGNLQIGETFIYSKSSDIKCSGVYAIFGDSEIRK